MRDNSLLKILLIDDDVLFIEGLKFLLDELREGITFSQAENLSDALTVLESDSFDLIILDYFYRNSQKQGFDVVKEVSKKSNGAKIVMLSGLDALDNNNPISIDSLKAFGLSGFIPKSVDQNVLICALKLIMDGESYFPNCLVNKTLAMNSKNVSNVNLQRLTKRQYEILEMAAEGTQNKVIADKLNLSIGTVKAHLSVIYQLLGVRNRTQAAHIMKGYQSE